MNRQIFLDMDGVIVDLHSAVVKRFPYADMTLFNRGELPVSDAELWGSTDADWWADLEWTDDGHEILALCEDFVGPENVIICTTPAAWPGGAEGKLRWIERNIANYARRYVLTPNKAWCANGRTLLIDDREKNCLAFREAGGASLLCPRSWNQLRGLPAVKYLKDAIVEMLP